MVLHFKDCHPDVARRSRAEHWEYFQALRHGVFCELGKGSVDFPAVLRWLKANSYDGYTLVEQDVLPGMGTPKESARRNREYHLHRMTIRARAKLSTCSRGESH